MTDTGPDILPDIRLREHVLQQIQTADSVFLPREVFEALYLNPERKVAGDLREKVSSLSHGCVRMANVSHSLEIRRQRHSLASS